MSLENVAADYFSNLNPIATRLHADLQQTKTMYEDLWDKLSQEEKDQILTESIIKPEVSVKYNVPEPRSSEEYAKKIVVDDHCSYRDEHSGPFSFRTKSQRNLTIFQSERAKTKPTHLTKPKAPAPSKPVIVNMYAEDLEDVQCHIEDGLSSNSSTLPKTGLDFLDNW